MIFNKAIEHLTSFSKGQKFDCKNYFPAVKIFEDKTFTAEFIESILNDEELKQEIISRSYIHYNGYGKLILFNNYDLDWRLRLHIWWGDEKRTAPDNYDIHNHTWDFVSTVLHGAFRNEIYKEIDSGSEGEDFVKHIYTIPFNTNEASLLAHDKTKLQKISSTDYIKGESYSQTKEMLHRAYPVKGNAVTLLLQQIGSESQSFVYKKHTESYENSIGLSGKLLTKSELEEILLEVFGWISRSKIAQPDLLQKSEV